MAICIKNPSKLPEKSIRTIRKFSEMAEYIRKKQ